MQEAKTSPAPAIRIVDESFDIKKSGSYHLSLLSNEKNLAFTVLDLAVNKYLLLQVQPLQFLNEMKFFEGIHFKSVTCALAHNKFTLVPSPLFDEENKESFLGFNHLIENDEEIHADTFNNIEARNLFTVSADFEAIIRKHFINVRFIHNATAFTEGLLVQNKNSTGKKVFANFHFSYFEAVILDGRELIFSNAFHYKAPEDIAYYILFIYEQLRLSPEEIELVLSGEIEKTAQEHSLLYSHIRYVSFAPRPAEFKYSYKFEEIPSHNLFSLFTQYLCV